MSKVDLITILGPTASGKTKLACHLAKKIGGEIISADSRQIYQGMDIGTGKDLDEYIVEKEMINYHLIDIKPAGYKYNIEEFQQDFRAAYQLIRENDHLPILCGGSGLYIETALGGGTYLGIPSAKDTVLEMEAWTDEQLELRYMNCLPKVKANLNAKTKQRKMRAIEIDTFLKNNPDWKPTRPLHLKPLIIGIEIDRDERRKKISDRLSYRMNHGLIEEVKRLIEQGLTYDDLDYYGLEYKWVGQYLQKKITKRELFEGLSTAIHQFAKKQMTWFRRMEKRGYPIHWLSSSNSVVLNIDSILDLIQEKA